MIFVFCLQEKQRNKQTNKQKSINEKSEFTSKSYFKVFSQHAQDAGSGMFSISDLPYLS